MLTDDFLRCGEPKPPSSLVELRAGPLRLDYDPAGGRLRRFMLGEKEVLRGIYFAVRDRNWGTVAGVLRERQRHIGADAFRIELEGEHREDEIHFFWHGVIEGRADGTVRFRCDGEALSRFLRNRIGFCVLHPIRECAGARARQIRTMSEVIACHLPRTIEPQVFGQASFRDLRGLAHEIEPGRWAELDFEGEVFEMEDQRNWTDASFKTYGTPLALPFPVEVRRGERMRQVVTLRLSADAAFRRLSSADGEARKNVTLDAAVENATRLPELGLGVSSDGEPLTGFEIQRLRALPLDHLRCDVRLAKDSWKTALRLAIGEARALGVSLELAVHLPQTGTAGLSDLRQIIEQGGVGDARATQEADARPIFSRILVVREGECVTRAEALALARESLGALGVPIGAGSECNFCELNREQALGRLPSERADFLFWPVNPQVHAVDSRSVMETLEAQGETVRTARVFAGERPLVITPVTLKPRFNPVATGPEAPLPPGQLPPQVDPRQLSLFAAAWTLGSLAALAQAGAASVTYFETASWRGVMARSNGSPDRVKFPAEPGMVYPVYLVLAALKGFERCHSVWSDAPQRVIGLGLWGDDDRRRVLLANLGENPVEANVKGVQGDWRVGRMDVERFWEMSRVPELFWAEPGEPVHVRGDVIHVALPGYAVAVLESEISARPTK